MEIYLSSIIINTVWTEERERDRKWNSYTCTVCTCTCICIVNHYLGNEWASHKEIVFLRIRNKLG